MDLKADEQIAEAWLATVGVSAFLDGGTVSLTPTAERRVQQTGDEITDELTRFFTRTKASPPDVDPVDIEQIASALYELPDDADMAERLEGFPDSIALLVAQYAARAVQYLRLEMPETLSRGITSEYRAPSPRDAAQFSLVFSVVDDPLLALRLLVAGQLSSRHVDALASAYPALYEAMKAEIPSVMVDVYAGKAEEIVLPGPREKQLYLFTRGKEINKELLNTVQSANEEAQAPSPRTRPAAAKATEIYAPASIRAQQ